MEFLALACILGSFYVDSIWTSSAVWALKLLWAFSAVKGLNALVAEMV